MGEKAGQGFLDACYDRSVVTLAFWGYWLEELNYYRMSRLLSETKKVQPDGLGIHGLGIARKKKERHLFVWSL